MAHLKKKSVKTGIRDLIVAAIGVIVLISVFKFVGKNNLLEAFEMFDKRYILLFALIQAFVVLMWNYKSVFIINEVTKIRFMDFLPVHLTGALLNNLTPGPSVGGEPVKAYYLSKKIKRPIAECLSIMVVDGGSYITIFSFLALFSMIYALLFVEILIIKIIVSVLMILSIVGIIEVVHFLLKKEKEEARDVEHLEKWIYRLRVFSFLKKRFKTLRKFEDFLEAQYDKFMKVMRYILANKKKAAVILFISLFVELLQVAKIWILFKGIAPVPFVHILVTTTIAMILGYLVFIPGGTGVVEVTMIAMFTAFGIDIGVAAVVTLISRAFFYLIVYVIGYISLLCLVIRHGGHKRKR